MIAYLSGSILHKDLRYLVIDTGGVGYKVWAPLDVLGRLALQEKTNLWIYTAVREDALDLYGFLDRETLYFFELLITISGIGPKSALGILSAASVTSLREAIISGETAYLTKIGGIGKKIAEKIVLELKDKIVYTTEEAAGATNQSDVDAIEALKALGYTHKESRDALEGLSKELKDPAEKVKAALRILGK